MPWKEAVYLWLIHSAMESLLVLTVGSGAVLLCRRPARRLWMIELTLRGVPHNHGRRWFVASSAGGDGDGAFGQSDINLPGQWPPF